MLRIGHRFRGVEPRRRARAFVAGLLAGLPRRNCWTIAEHAGDTTPDGMQHLLSRACWDADGVRDDVRGYVTEHLGDPGAVLVVDETGDVKKGAATAGVQRQYTGTAGRVENAQVGVYLTYAAPGGHALIDREVYLPRSWAGDPARRAAAGIPAGTASATKPALAMIACALDAGTPAPGRPRPRSTAPTPGYAPTWKPAASATCWPWPPATSWPPPPGACGRPRWPPRCRRGPGSGYRPGPARRGSAGMTGPGSPSGPAGPGTGGC
jgi:hypothetical protein